MKPFTHSPRVRSPHREERHEREQYFDDPTRSALADLLEAYSRPCCLCAPTVGEELHARGRPARVLDIDERFSHLPGFRRWNMRRPEHLGERFDVIVCDPPFFTVSLSELFRALRLLQGFDPSTPVVLTHLTRRAHAVEAAMRPLGVGGIRRIEHGPRPGYLTVRPTPRNHISYFANIPMPNEAEIA